MRSPVRSQHLARNDVALYHATMRVTLEMIAVLREKYREIKRLRVVDAEHVASGHAHDPKPEMAALARKFPGALRELDELPMEQIDERLAALDEALALNCVPDWAALQVAYHGTYRFALRIKRLSARRGALDDEALARAIQRLLEQAASERTAAEPDEPRLADFDAAALHAILRPEGGRLHLWVLRHVAHGLGVAPAAVSQALFARERVAG
jgi:hypothetical protein